MAETEFVIEPGRQDIITTRVFDAPPDVVYKVVTDPELIPNWWGPREVETVVDVAEYRPGGRWRFFHRAADGSEYGFRGIVHDAVPADRLVQTFEFEGMPGHVALETLTFEDVGGKTRYKTVQVFQSVEDRDGMVASGMREGAEQTLDQLAEILKTR